MAEQSLLLSKWIQLNSVHGIGPRRAEKLVQLFGGIENIFQASLHEIIETRIFNKNFEDFKKIKDEVNPALKSSIEQALQNGIKITTLVDAAYPRKLRLIPDSPTTLFTYGDYGLLNKSIIAVVGTRAAGENAKNFTKKICLELAGMGYIICSGGARGIDTAAHLSALEAGNGTTICVFGTGLDKVYPPENAPLFEQIKQRGGLIISENLPNYPGSETAFLRRNRITSGISDGLILVSSSATGGAMVQSKIAHTQGRQIYCPSLDLCLEPCEGVKYAIEHLGAVEFRSVVDFLDLFNKSHLTQ